MILPQFQISPEWLEYDIHQREWVLKEGAPDDVVEKYKEYLKEKKEYIKQGFK